VDTYYKLEKVEEILSPENLVQEMLISLFMSVMSHQDDSGRYILFYCFYVMFFCNTDFTNINFHSP